MNQVHFRFCDWFFSITTLLATAKELKFNNLRKGDKNGSHNMEHRGKLRRAATGHTMNFEEGKKKDQNVAFIGASKKNQGNTFRVCLV